MKFNKQILILILISSSFCAIQKIQETIDTKEFKQKFKVEVIARGDSQIFPKYGDEVTIHYHAKNMNGEVYDSSFKRQQPFTFNLGSQGVIKCWNEAARRMQLGDRINVTCPSQYAYGTHGLGEILPPDSDTVIELELLGINGKKLTKKYKDDL